MLGGGLQPGVNQRPHRRRRRRRHSTVVETWKHLTSRHRAITKSPPSPPAAVPAPGGLQFSGGRTAEGPRLADAVGVGRSEHQLRRSRATMVEHHRQPLQHRVASSSAEVGPQKDRDSLTQSLSDVLSTSSDEAEPPWWTTTDSRSSTVWPPVRRRQDRRRTATR